MNWVRPDVIVLFHKNDIVYCGSEMLGVLGRSRGRKAVVGARKSRVRARPADDDDDTMHDVPIPTAESIQVDTRGAVILFEDSPAVSTQRLCLC